MQLCPRDRRTLETWRGFARSARLLAHRPLDAAPCSLQYTHSIPYPERLERMMVDRLEQLCKAHCRLPI
jgi:hypothetical protein